MNREKRRALEEAGFIFEDAEDFLELTAEERQLVELRVSMSRAVRERRISQRLTQQEVARRLKSSQSKPRPETLEVREPAQDAWNCRGKSRCRMNESRRKLRHTRRRISSMNPRRARFAPGNRSRPGGTCRGASRAVARAGLWAEALPFRPVRTARSDDNGRTRAWN